MTDADIIADIIEREGGFVDHPADRGGPTKYGITLRTLRAERPLATVDDLKALTKDEAAAIYRQRYLFDYGFDRIKDASLRALVVDSTVHHGAGRPEGHGGPEKVGSIHLLQRAMGVDDDGIFGIITERAANLSPNLTRRAMVRERSLFMARIVVNDPSQLPFLIGWLKRAFQFIEA